MPLKNVHMVGYLDAENDKLFWICVTILKIKTMSETAEAAGILRTPIFIEGIMPLQ